MYIHNIFNEIIMNSKRKGNITELECMLAFIKLGYNVLTPYGDCERYDFVVNKDNKFYKIQCKTSSSDNNGATFSFDCRSIYRKNGKFISNFYTKEEIDYFATSFNGKVYLVPVEECGYEKALRLEPPKNGQTKGVFMAKKL